MPQDGRHRAARYATVLAGTYVLVSGGYIVASGELAARMSQSLGELKQVELIKGIGFVVLTGLMLFALSLVLFMRLQAASEHLAQSRETLLRADRAATPGLLAASIAHDFKNVLALLQASAEVLEDQPSEQEARETLVDLRAAIQRGSDLAGTLSRAGRTSASGQPCRVDVRQLVIEALELLRYHRLARQRQLRFEDPGPLSGTVFPVLVHQIVTNLVLNALDAVKAQGTVLVRLSREADGLCLEVHDDGPGVPPALRDLIFDPFFTTKPDGTGLGLLSVRTCAELHGGVVQVLASDRLSGALFRVRLSSPEALEGSA